MPPKPRDRATHRPTASPKSRHTHDAAMDSIFQEHRTKIVKGVKRTGDPLAITAPLDQQAMTDTGWYDADECHFRTQDYRKPGLDFYSDF